MFQPILTVLPGRLRHRKLFPLSPRGQHELLLKDILQKQKFFFIVLRCPKKGLEAESRDKKSRPPPPSKTTFSAHLCQFFRLHFTIHLSYFLSLAVFSFFLLFIYYFPLNYVGCNKQYVGAPLVERTSKIT
jgi:hypothetical protein